MIRSLNSRKHGFLLFGSCGCLCGCSGVFVDWTMVGLRSGQWLLRHPLISSLSWATQTWKASRRGTLFLVAWRSLPTLQDLRVLCWSHAARHAHLMDLQSNGDHGPGVEQHTHFQHNICRHLPSVARHTNFVTLPFSPLRDRRTWMEAV